MEEKLFRTRLPLFFYQSFVHPLHNKDFLWFYVLEWRELKFAVKERFDSWSSSIPSEVFLLHSLRWFYYFVKKVCDLKLVIAGRHKWILYDWTIVAFQELSCDKSKHFFHLLALKYEFKWHRWECNMNKRHKYSLLSLRMLLYPVW